MPLEFDEVRLPEDISEQSSGGPGFNDVIIATPSGEEQAVQLWAEGRLEWDLQYAVRTQDQLAEFIEFFRARRARVRGFRFKDWTDFEIEEPTSTEQITTTTFQIRKAYVSGGQTVYRTIKKIAGDNLSDTAADDADSTVRVFQADGTTEVTSGWTVNLTTGVITFGVAPGYVPKVTCEFDVPVRFDTLRPSFTAVDNIRGISSIPVIEIRV
jgi:uncharacterized protein (TIGR02217 family)